MSMLGGHGGWLERYMVTEVEECEGGGIDIILPIRFMVLKGGKVK